MNKTKATVGKYRWTIAALLLFSTTINYMDRNVIGYLKDYFCSVEGFGWSATDFSVLTSIFTGFYAGFTLVAGWIIDKIGTKIGMVLALSTWSVAGILSAFMGHGLVAHNFARAIFGAGEAGNFPASIKTVAEWFPKKERALATGIFNSGSNVGAMICALVVPVILYAWYPTEDGSGNLFLGIFHGWQMAFIITGVIGFVWLAFWGKLYGAPKHMLEKGKITQAEFDYIHSDDEYVSDAQEVKTKVPWGKMLSYKQTWSFVVGKFLTDGIWWFLLFWLPTYIKQTFCVGMTPEETKYTVMISTFIVYGIAIVGSIYGGAIPMQFMNKGWEAYKARMTSMLLIAIAPLCLLFTQAAAVWGGIVAAVAIISLGGSAHQAWSANLFTTVSDMFPKKAVGTVTGIGAAAGGLGGVLVQLLAGFMEDSYRIKGIMAAKAEGLIHAAEGVNLKDINVDDVSKFVVDPSMVDRATDLISSSVSNAYGLMFGVCAFAYLLGWGIMKLLVPKHTVITDL